MLTPLLAPSSSSLRELKPKHAVCPHCQASVISRVRLVPGGLVIGASLALLLLRPNWYAAPIIPWCLSDLKDVEQVCPACQSMISRISRFRLLRLVILE